MELINSINVWGIDFDIYKGPLGISCSGGADSSSLLYMLMLNTAEKINIFTTVSNFKQRKSLLVTANVIEKCISLTGNSNIEQHLHFCDNQTINNLFTIPKKWLHDDLITVLYTGITATPPFDVMESFNNKMDIVDKTQRNPKIKKETFKNKFYMPFYNINKQRIMDLYNHYGLIDNLYPITRSCEWTTDYDAPDPGLGHCGKCWWCEERAWGSSNYNV